MKILIADDEKLIRYMLKSMLLEIMSESIQIIEAKNGMEMVEMCVLHQPDVAFVDIHMPKMDGISAIRKAKEYSNNIRFVILTAYSDFGYAKECIALQVENYILKPISSEALGELMHKLISKQSHQKKDENLRFQLQTINTFQYWDEVGFSEENQAASDAADTPEEILFLGGVYFIDCVHHPELYKSCYKELNLLIKKYFDGFVTEGINYVILPSKEGFLRVIVRIHKEQENAVICLLERICRKLARIDCLISCLYQAAKDLPATYINCEELDRSNHIRFFFSPGSAKVIPDHFEQTYQSEIAFCRLLKELLLAFMKTNEIAFMDTLDTMRTQYKTVPKRLALDVLSQYVASFTGFQAKAENDKKFYQSLQQLPRFMCKPVIETKRDKVKAIKDYIAENYMNDISITTVAEKFELSPNYLSSLFHEKTGTTFTKYLTDVRMTYAKQILKQDKDIYIKDAALRVGYMSPRHFTKLFIKHTGIHPSEYYEKGVENEQ